jgi:guanine deaminase
MAILAHSIHLTDREIGRLRETGARIAHCPASNLFLSSGTMPLARYLDAGLSVGLGSDVAGGPEVSVFSVMRAGAYAQSAYRTLAGDSHPPLPPLDWLRLGTLDGARALGQEAEIGSLEVGKDADFIAVDTSATAPLVDDDVDAPSDIVSRLIFRTQPGMVRGAWVRGRQLATTDAAA